jgi:glycosyltransferase involved in cell wall biosynthesis
VPIAATHNGSIGRHGGIAQVGSLCIVGVDDNAVLKDFVRAHIELLPGTKILVDHWYPDLRHDGYTIRLFYGTRPLSRRLAKLLPQVAYQRLISRHELSEHSIHDALAAFFRYHDVDMVLAEFGPTGADIAPHTKKLGIPLVVHFHGHDAHRAKIVEDYRERYRSMFDIAFRMVTVSRFMSDALIELGADPAKIVLNPYGPRDRFFSVIPDYRPVVLSLGRFTDIKANYLTLAAFAKVAASNPDASLIMVGDGELLETCKTLAIQWGIQHRVSFPGAVPHAKILPFFEHACCFAQHSVTPSYGDAEGTPVAIIEAGAAGLPVVATRHAGIPDVVVHGETGFLVEERDVDGMAAYMLRLINDSALARTMGENARQRVRQHFSLDRHITSLNQVLEDARRA